MAEGNGNGVNRRALLTSAGGVALAALGATGLGSAESAAAAAARVKETAATQMLASIPPVGGTEKFVTVVEGTNIAAAVSPDGKTIAFDLFGSLWLVGMEGGIARRMTDDLHEIAQPDWSPDGRTIGFQSYRDGNFHVWTIRADGSGLMQLTQGPHDCREPRFSPDGKRIAFSSDRSGRYAIHVLELSSGKSQELTKDKAQESEPAWSRDGKRIAFVADGTKIVVFENGVGSEYASIEPSADLMRRAEIHGPSFTPDGSALTYVVLESGATRLMRGNEVLVANEDIFPFRVSWVGRDEFVFTSNGKIKRGASEVPFSATVPVVTPSYVRAKRDFDVFTVRPVVGIGSPQLSPDGQTIVFRALNDLYTMRSGEAPKSLLGDRFYKCDPAWSPDGKTLAYSSDRGGKLDIWLRDLQSGSDKQLTQFATAAVSGSWSADNKLIAFLDQTGALHTVEVATGAVRKVFESIWEPGRPTWSADGRFIAMAAFKPYSARYREGLSEILVIERETGVGSYAPALPDRSLSTRGDDGPIWSPDGKLMAFVLASTLWVVPVDTNGRFIGAPKQITTEVTDAPSWSGDSRTLLYLSNGKFRLVSATGGVPREVPFDLTYRNAKAPERTIIRAGRLWNGHAPDYLRGVDLTIEGNRIAAVDPMRSKSPSDRNARFVDALNRTVIPGLVDMHTHRQMQGYSYGDRQGRLWLAMGVTSTRSPGAPAYHMVEDREAIDSGARIGPRHFATGEAIDGSRIFYNFMRPVTEEGQLALELQRAEALSYDMVKTYVRLSPEKQKAVIEWAHARGLQVSSHYHFPAFRFGGDCTEHLGATNRLGYSRTVSALGAGYQDVAALFTHSGAGRTPTLFLATALLGEDRSLVDDARIKTLYPAWEYARLKARAEQMAASDRTPLLASLERNVAQVKTLLRSGGRVLTGTDAPIDFVAVSLHLNLRGMVKYGVTPYEALLTATRFPGEFMNEPIGTVTPGALADLLVVEGDPLANIDAAAAVRQVMKNGELFTIGELIGPFKAPSASAAAGHGHESFTHNPEFWWHGIDYVESSRAACCQQHALPRLPESKHSA